MNAIQDLLTPSFRDLSARAGSDPLQVQGPGGNASVKDGKIMWIKASGTELADARTKDIFVAVDLEAARSEARGETGDGSCIGALLDPTATLRPSIETTFHAALEHAVVLHTHSVATLVHAVSPEGRRSLTEKLAGLPHAMVPYVKPGLPLTGAMLACIGPETQIIVLANHGLVVCGATSGEVAELSDRVEELLRMPVLRSNAGAPETTAPEGFHWSRFNWLAVDPRAARLAVSGTYYPDHVVFLGSGLPTGDHSGKPPAVLKAGEGVLMRNDATPSQRAMLRCLSDVLSRLPEDWSAEPIGVDAEAELLNWDAEQYRQTLAER